MSTYAKLTFRPAGPKTSRTVWVRPAGELNKKGIRIFRVVDREGERQNELIVLTSNDILSLRPAKMNLHYGELEVVSAKRS